MDGRNMNRRSYVVSVLTFSAIISGCTNGEPETQVPLGKIDIVNLREEGTRAEIRINKDDENVYNTEHQFSDADEMNADLVEIEEEWLGEESNYSVFIEVMNGESKDSVTTEDINNFVSDWNDDECAHLLIRIEEEDINFAVSGLESCPQ